MEFDNLDKMGTDVTFTTGWEPLPPSAHPLLDDVMDWWSVAREMGEKLTNWQKRYPAYAEDLAEFETFLQRTATIEDSQII